MKAKRYLLAGVALTALGTAVGIGAAQSADMAVVKAPPAAYFTWTGGYVGVTAGEAWGSYDTNTQVSGVGYINAPNRRR
jgi:opacity protein-like surface antigen